ncbi:MAG: putative flap endonuclease-1-like 5' DNA nuclease [Halobacteriales archaeon]|jgi:predicted flap endonuclease-1-like 5' DNA nuclease
MTLLDKLKSWLGLERSEREEQPGRDVGVTVEREPDEPSTETEAAVKGTEEPGSEAETEPGAETAGTSEADTGTGDTAEPGAEKADPAEEATDVTDIKGIGPAYADRLSEAGVRSVADLADADPEELAAETDISATRIENWIEQASVR